MPNFTRKAIQETFISLLNERPLKQITVNDIVDACGINRNTFYYHFADIPTLLQEIITEEAESIIENYPTLDSIEQCLEVALQFAIKNKRAVLHIYNSVSRHVYEQYLMQVCDYVITTYCNTLFSDKKLSDADKTLIISLYKCTCFGIVIDWMANGMRADILSDLHRLCALQHGAIETMIDRAAAD